MSRPWISVIAVLLCSIVMAGGNTSIGVAVDRQSSAVSQRAIPVSQADTRGVVSDTHEKSAPAILAPNLVLDWWSVNGGGEVPATSASYRMGLSVAQPAAGEATSASYRMGLGFWYGVSRGTVICPVTMTGDVNVNGSISSADIIYLVSYVFKGGSLPQPCEAAGDVNCNASVTSADIIYLVAYVFKSGPAPCDVCTMIPGTWTCP